MLTVNNLSTYLKTATGYIKPVDNISFSLESGKTLAIIGESGCGKSISALSLMRLLPMYSCYSSESEIFLENTNILNLSEQKMLKIRGKEMAMIFQDPMTSLNPVLTVGEQIFEVLRLWGEKKHRNLKANAIELLKLVRIPDPEQRLYNYPHELSGGMRQRVMIAIAMALKPKVLIADEPTTALDVTTQAQILSLLKNLQQQTGTAIILITHDLGLAYQIADSVALMYAGEFVEFASRDEFFNNYSHPYAIQLLQAMPSLKLKNKSLLSIPGRVPSLGQEFNLCRFLSRCKFAQDTCKEVIPKYNEVNSKHFSRCHFKDLVDHSNKVELDNTNENINTKEVNTTVVAMNTSKIATTTIKTSIEEKTTIEHKGIENKTIVIDDFNSNINVTLNNSLDNSKDVLNVSGLQVYFPEKNKLFWEKQRYLKAVDNVAFNLKQGKTLALVGESGCGKTTLAKAVLSLTENVVGKVVILSKSITNLNKKQLRDLRKDVQVIFQDPYSSLDPRLNIRDIILEGYVTHNKSSSKQELDNIAKKIITSVGLSIDDLAKFPHAFSGGQRQRISIARCLALNPKLIILDEPTSALDLSVQAQILNLLKSLQKKHNLSFLFITHNISVVEYMADNVAVMYLGRIVEYGTVEEVVLSPKHPYTQDLIAAIPKVGSKLELSESSLIKGEAASALNPPSGCHYNPRCKFAKKICLKAYPNVKYFNFKSYAYCHLYSE